MDDVPLSIEPIVGWRAWRLTLVRGRPRLIPIGKGRPWPVLQEAIASCFLHRRHRPPEIGCTCGIYAARDRDLLREARSPGVVGTVALWGRVAEHRLGWRAAVAYPSSITLVCHVCLFQRGVHASPPDVVVGHRDGSLVPLCDDHLRVARACDQAFAALIPAETVFEDLTRSYRAVALTS